jgi:hypothetical protein
MTDSLSQHCPNCEEQAGKIVGLRAQLHMVLDREADTHCRHDAKVEAQAAEIERLRDALGIAIVLVAAELPYAPMLQHLRAALAGKAEQ